MKYINLIVFVFPMAFALNQISGQIPPTAPATHLLNEVVDISGDFRDFSNTYYLADSLGSFDPETGKGSIVYNRYEYTTRQAFNNMLAVLEDPLADRVKWKIKMANK